MKKVLLIVAVLVLSVCAQANAITITDVWNPSDVFLNHSDVYNYTHNILDNGFSIGDLINSANIAIIFRDDESGGDGESVRIQLDGNTVGNATGNIWYNNGSHTQTFTYTVNTTYLNTDGILNVSLRNNDGDVYFAQSTLTANITRAVPEPMTLSLLGTGLLGLFGFRRKTS